MTGVQTCALPICLSLNAITGLISGTPTVAQVAASYAVTAYGPGGTGTASVSITVAAPPVIAYTSASISATRRVTITPDTVLSTGGAVTGYSVSPALPAGLSLNTSTGLISGKPTVVSASANYSVVASGPGGLDTAVVSIAVQDTAPAFAYLHPTSDYLKNSAISPNTVVSSGGAVTVYHVSPSLPNGLSLDTVSGAISGTPTDTSVAMDYTVTGTGPGGSGVATVNIAVSSSLPPPVVAYVRPSPSYVKHVAIVPDSILSSGGPVTVYHVSPALPNGLSLDTVTGVISGTPSGTSASANYSVIAMGAGGLDTAVLNITVQDTAPAISYVRASFSAVKNVAITPDTAVLVGTGAVNVYHVSPALPTGLTLDSVSGRISGTPTVVAASANYTVTATGPGGNGQSVVSVAVADTAPNIAYVRSSISGVPGTGIIPDTVVLVGTGAVSVYHVSPALPSGLTLEIGRAHV